MWQGSLLSGQNRRLRGVYWSAGRRVGKGCAGFRVDELRCRGIQTAYGMGILGGKGLGVVCVVSWLVDWKDAG